VLPLRELSTYRDEMDDQNVEGSDAASRGRPGAETSVAWSAAAAREWIAVPAEDSDKYRRGVLGVITGSARYPGAAVLGVEAAVRTGLGMVRYIGDQRAADFVLHRRPEVVTASGRVQAWLLGSGMDAESRGDEATSRLRDALAQAVPAVVDAGALDLIADAVGPVIVTPHYRELARVMKSQGVDCSVDEIAARPARWARQAARILNVTVLLKGHATQVASPEGEQIVVQLAPTWLATAGSGDVLAGILGALVATHAESIDADGHGALVRLGASAAAIHGLAAERASAGGPIAALDVAEAVPATIAALLAAPSSP
jgi:hydroxyethylthiazole kinase-like uncharacterized protein yjeF